MTSTDLAGSTALVTGGTSGIGRAAAVLLARRGAHVLVSGRDAARGDEAVSAIRAAGGKSDFIPADLASGTSVRELARRAIELGGGHVDILVNSVPGMALYGSSKAALTLLTKAWAAEFGPNGVRVNAVSPGPTRTLGTEPMGDQLDQLASLAPAGRPAAPEEIATAISYLAGDEASFVHGAILDVDGGRHAA